MEEIKKGIHFMKEWHGVRKNVRMIAFGKVNV
jgi:hypothetical protein